MTIAPPRKLEKHVDPRGWVAEVLRPELLPAALRKSFGQIYLSAANEGQVKANHYHTRKHEWFWPVRGTVLIVLQQLDSKGRPAGLTETFTLTADEPAVLFVPALVAHAIKAVGGPATVAAYITEPYDPKDTDTFPCPLLEPD